VMKKAIVLPRLVMRIAGYFSAYRGGMHSMMDSDVIVRKRFSASQRAPRESARKERWRENKRAATLRSRLLAEFLERLVSRDYCFGLDRCCSRDKEPAASGGINLLRSEI
jgi:hypothetical protein